MVAVNEHPPFLARLVASHGRPLDRALGLVRIPDVRARPARQGRPPPATPSMTVRGRPRTRGIVHVDFLGMRFEVEVAGRTWRGVVEEVLSRSSTGYGKEAVLYEVRTACNAILDLQSRADANQSPILVRPLSN